jgi:hypothetical protein
MTMERKSKRLAIMMKHREMVKQGKMDVAWSLLQLLRKHSISLGYSDGAYETERICERLGCHIAYRGRYYIAYVYDWGNANER